MLNPPARWPLLGTGVLAILGGWLFLMLLDRMGMGCVPRHCSLEGLRTGAQLFVGAVALAALGGTLLAWPGRPAGPAPRPQRLFTSLAFGLVVVIAYVSARSWFNEIVWDLPVSFAELLSLCLLVVVAGVLARRAHHQTPRDVVSQQGRLLDLLWLLLLCVVVASRELPRVVNLSSDPDTHVFFGTLIERFGAVPFHLREWGPGNFDYPAGSGLVLFIWHQFTGLDMRGLVAALPVLFSFLAALVVVEMVARDVTRAPQRLLLQLAAITVTAAAFMFPLYKEYFHGEGGARVLSVLPAALLLGFVVASIHPMGEGWVERRVLPTLAVVVLALLNPANVVIPAVLLWALFVFKGLQGERWIHLPIIFLTALMLLLAEPYYQVVFGLAEKLPSEGILFAERFSVKALPVVLADAWRTWTAGYGEILRDMAVLFDEKSRPIFLTVFLVLLVMLVVLYRGWRLNRAAAWSALAFLGGLYLAHGFARSLLDDQRFFLLAPYIFFNMTQYKALLLIAMMVFVIKKPLRWPLGLVWALAAAAALVFFQMLQVRGVQEMYLSARKDYCGAFGCLAESDFRLLQAFEVKVRDGQFPAVQGVTPKVLLPNAPMRTEHESWVLPVSSARVLPLYDVLPAAFYYYRGEPDYGTVTYQARVCEQLDRAWLRARNIDYIYLPSNRERACVAGMEDLIQTEEVVLQEGQAYLLKFR